MYKWGKSNRWEQISQQERLILQKKKEIEDKFKADQLNAVKSKEAESQSNIDEKKKEPDVFVQNTCNKFENDGSFLERFRKMQEEAKKKTQSCQQSHVEKIPSPYNDSQTSDQMTEEADTDKSSDEENKKVSSLEEKQVRIAIEKCAIYVAMNGPSVEDELKKEKKDDPYYRWLFDKDDVNHQYYFRRIKELQCAKRKAEGEETDTKVRPQKFELEEKTTKKRKRRWNDPGAENNDQESTVKRDPELIKYALQVFGKCDLTSEQWKQLEDQRKMKVLVKMMQSKQRKKEYYDMMGKVNYEYDSDEEIEGGTWEHKRREEEMEQTRQWANELTEMNRGKHHLGDFLPPEELEKFMLKWEAIKDGSTSLIYDSDYNQFKLESSNVGYKMLQKLGWSEGKGLGFQESGIVEPVSNEGTSSERGGLGQLKPSELTEDDDEYEAYRKRMMLAYRFRPNPLNNPRRPYY